MKLLYCQLCGDIVAPFPQRHRIRTCACAAHAVWWENPLSGVLRVQDCRTQAVTPSEPRAWVIGLTNALLGYGGESIRADTVQMLIDRHDDSYIFRQIRSLVIRIRPGDSNDTAWSNKPGDIVAAPTVNRTTSG